MSVANFQIWLQANMDGRGWTYADLAREAGLSKQAISHYMSSRSKYPTIEGIAAICKAFQVPVSSALVTLGLIPRHGKNPNDEEVVTLFDELDPEDQLEALAYLRYRLEQRKKAGRKQAKK